MRVPPPAKIHIEKIKGKGRGVVAAHPIEKGEIIEHCPITVISERDSVFVDRHSDFLKFYSIYLIKLNRWAIMHGFGMLYNHSREPNADIRYTVNDAVLEFIALRNIPAGEEIVIDYDFDNGIEDFLPS